MGELITKLNELNLSEYNKDIKGKLIKELRSLYSEKNNINYTIERKSSGYWIRRQVNEPNYNRLLEVAQSKIDMLEKILFDKV